MERYFFMLLVALCAALLATIFTNAWTVLAVIVAVAIVFSQVIWVWAGKRRG
jgi:Na+/H+ antiporter NhaB